MSDTSNNLTRPSWIRVRSSCSQDFEDTLKVVRKHNVHTICEESLCPNIVECWKKKTATFLIMGDVCTRRCGFCNVKTGVPGKLDEKEPENVALAIKELGIKYAVITSVTRDDIPDGGAEHFALVIKSIREHSPQTKIEILTSDFAGNIDALRVVADAAPDVFGHNLEIVKSLHKKIKRPPASYEISLNFLKNIKIFSPEMITKTGIMVGVGEQREEVIELIKDVVDARVDVLTIGQYLTPSTKHYPIFRYVTLEEFDEYKQIGESSGIQSVVSGPLVRSSYKAGDVFSTICKTNFS